MKFINSVEIEPSTSGTYHCINKGVKVVLHFVIIKPKKEHFVINENYNDDLLNENRYWKSDVNDSIFIKSNSDLYWLDEE